MNNNQIILVDKDDNQIGLGEKIKVHQDRKLHRCFSVFVFNDKGELLIQKRAKNKYHSAGLWSNACCSHPRPDKDITKEAETRLEEEMGFNCPLTEVFSFIYRVDFEKLSEYEFDHTFIGKFNGNPKPDPNEAEGWKWIAPDKLKQDMADNPENYTFWLKKILDRVLKQIS